MHTLIDYLNRKVVKPLIQFLKQGTSPHKLAISISLGFVLGLFPMLGVTTFVGFAISFVFKLNVAAIQLVNYLMYPVQIALIIPFIKIGSWLFGTDSINYTITELIEYMSEDFYGALANLWELFVLGIFAWGILIIPLGLVMFVISKSALVKMKGNIKVEAEINQAKLTDH